jgi:hypothetical protein
MWLLFTASLALALVLTEWLPTTWPLYRELPVIGDLSRLGGTAALLAGVVVVTVVTMMVYSILWLVGHAVNYLRPGSFDAFTGQLDRAKGLPPAMLALLWGVPLLLVLATYLGHGSYYAWGLGVMIMISAAYNLRPFSLRLQLLRALRDAPNQMMRGTNPWAGLPAEEEPTAPSQGAPPVVPDFFERIEGGDEDWLGADLS